MVSVAVYLLGCLSSVKNLLLLITRCLHEESPADIYRGNEPWENVSMFDVLLIRFIMNVFERDLYEGILGFLAKSVIGRVRPNAIAKSYPTATAVTFFSFKERNFSGVSLGLKSPSPSCPTSF